MKGLFKRGPRIPEVGDAKSSDPYGRGATQPTDDELLAEYGGGSRTSHAQTPYRQSGSGQPAQPAQPAQYGQSGQYGPSRQHGQTAPGQYGQTPAPRASQPFVPPSAQRSDPYAQTFEQGQQPLDPEEEEIQAIKYQMRTTKQESLSSTRNALRLARETEETASNTMMKLGEQSDTIGDTERHLDVSKAHASRAEDNAREIANLNKSIFRPKWKRDRRAKREAQEAKAIQRHIDERMDREVTREEVLTSQRRVEDSMQGGGAFGRFRAKLQGPNEEVLDPKAQRARYQFEATQSDDELEDELDNNLDDIAALSARMNVLSRAMGQEVDTQNTRLARVSDKTTDLDTRIYAGTQRLERLK